VARLTTFIAGAGFGAGLVYILDNPNRRAVARDKAVQYAREGGGTVQSAAQTAAQRAQAQAQTAAQRAQTQAQGVASRVQSAATGGDSAPDDDVTLTRKVESEIFRDADAPKGQVNVQAVNGVVELRGQLEDRAVIQDLEAKARNVTGVREVRNLLHLPGETPVNIVGTPGTPSSS
jgi:osmotically-inducible protein OsmY